MSEYLKKSRWVSRTSVSVDVLKRSWDTIAASSVGSILIGLSEKSERYTKWEQFQTRNLACNNNKDALPWLDVVVAYGYRRWRWRRAVVVFTDHGHHCNNNNNKNTNKSRKRGTSSWLYVLWDRCFYEGKIMFIFIRAILALFANWYSNNSVVRKRSYVTN